MNSKRQLFSIIFLLGIIMMMLYAGEDDLLIVTEEWAPYNYMKNSRITGFSTEIVQKIQEILDIDIDMRLFPSIRTSNMLKSRPYTMMYSMFRTQEREGEYKWIGPLADATIYFYKRKDDLRQITSLDDIKKVQRIACRHAGLIPDLLQEMGFTNLDMTSTSSLSIYQKLLAGRCDLAISDTDLGVRYHLRNLNVKLDDVFEIIPIPVFKDSLYIACSNDIPDKEIQRWQDALNLLRANGDYERIYRKYY